MTDTTTECFVCDGAGYIGDPESAYGAETCTRCVGAGEWNGDDVQRPVETICASCGKLFVDLDNMYRPIAGHRCPSCVNGTVERKPFDRAEHCRQIAAHGGAATVARYGNRYMQTIGKAGYAATAAKIGKHNARALVYGKGWSGSSATVHSSLIDDLAFGRQLAQIAA